MKHRPSETKVSKNTILEVHSRIASAASMRLRQIVENKARNGFSRDTNQFKFGVLSDEGVKKYEKITGIKILNKDMYTGQASIFHHRGGKKAEKGKEAELEDIINMPKNIGSMDVYIHSGALVFTDYKNKYVLQPNQSVKIDRNKTIVTNHMSSSKVKDRESFDIERGYIKITP